MFTPGRLLFALFFVLVFLAGMIWSYRRDKAVNQVHFKRPYLVLLALIAFILLMYLLVKMRRYL